MTKTLDLRFKAASGKEAVISVPDPIDGLTLAQATDAMNIIIAKNVFTISGSELVSIVNAAIRISDKQVLV